MTEEMGLPEHLQAVPPTARLVYRYLDDADRPCTARELSEWCRTPKSSIHDALRDLQAAGLAEQTDRAGDPTTPHYTTA